MFFRVCRIFALLTALLIQAQAATITGFITEANSGEPIGYVNVIVKNQHIGSVSNYKGYYVITGIKPGVVELLFDHISYQSQSRKLSINGIDEQMVVNLELNSGEIAMQEIVVEDSADAVNGHFITTGNLHATTREIKQAAQIAEADVFRAVQAMPGVSAISDYSSGLYVRGGSQDQNLILIDGIDVYNPTHFGGVFSTFNTDAIRDVELLKSSYPAQYGGRLSSVLNVSNKDGNRKEFDGIARLSILSTSATVEGPWQIDGHQGSYMVSGRRTYLDIVDMFLSADLPNYYFYDGHAKFNIDLSDQDKLSFSTYLGKDNLKFDFGSTLRFVWGNETFSSQWIHIFSPQFFSHFILAGSHYGSDFIIDTDSEKEFMKRENNLTDLSIKGIMNYKPNEDHAIDFGFEMKQLDINFRFTSKDDNADTSHMPNVDTKNYNTALYAQESWKISPVWTLQLGVRSAFNHTSSNLPGASGRNDIFIEPRFSIRRKLSLESALFFSYGHYSQFLTSVNMGEASPFDLWFPLDKSVKPGVSNHFTVGYKTTLWDGIDFDIETYYKDYDHLVEYRMETDWEWNNSTGKLGDIFNMGKGFSYGIDILFKTNWKNFEGFVGYAFGITRRKVENMNMNPNNGVTEYYYPKYDRTHQINVVETYSLPSKIWGADWKIGLSYAYYTGQPYYQPERWYVNNDYQLNPIYSYSDRFRLPNYSRFDVNLNMRWDHKSWAIEPYLQIINVFNSENVWFRTYTPQINPENPMLFTIKNDDATMFPRIPFVGVNIVF